MHQLSVDTTVQEYFTNNQDYVWKRIKHILVSKVSEKLKVKTKGTEIRQKKIEEKTEEYLYRYLKSIAKSPCLFDLESSQSIDEIHKKYKNKKQQVNNLLKKIQKKDHLLQHLQQQNRILQQSMRTQKNENRELAANQVKMEEQFQQNINKLYRNLQISIHNSSTSKFKASQILQNKFLLSQITGLSGKIRNQEETIQKMSKDKRQLSEKLERESREKIYLSAYASELKMEFELLEKSKVEASTIIEESRMQMDVACRKYVERIRQLEQQLAITEKVGLRLNKFLQMEILSRYLAMSKDSERSQIVTENENWEIYEAQNKIEGRDSIKKRKSFRNASNPQLLAHKTQEIHEQANTNLSTFENSIWETFSQQNNYSLGNAEVEVQQTQICMRKYGMKEELESAKEELETIKKRNMELESIISQRELALKESLIQKGQIENEKIRLQERIVEEREEFEAVLRIERSRVLKLEQEVREVGEREQEERKQAQRITQNIQSEKIMIQQEINTLKNQLQIQESLYFDTSAKIPTLETTISSLQSLLLSANQQLRQNQLLNSQLQQSLSKQEEALQQKQLGFMEYTAMIDSHFTASFSLYTHALAQKNTLLQENNSLKLELKTCGALLEKNQSKIHNLNQKINQLSSEKSALLCKLGTFLKISSSQKVCSATQTPLLQQKLVICQFCEEKDGFLEQNVKNRINEDNGKEKIKKLKSEGMINKQTVTRHLLQFCDIALPDRKKKQSLQTLIQILEMTPTDKKIIQEHIRRSQALTRKKQSQNPQEHSLQNKFFKFLKQ